ncbi:aminotransferase class I/II-fold pyridoxal phosphate-dependent enzyme [Flavihumibacter sp. CACIAM 22H1]|uniref:threonine aldolase family protein n=1 Tax=Flavihumibacter sp. CACIAM 22H1 TaxID=1812911 RepID=UPI0007A8F2EE|nr:aminotransferase class I/II-fold pyridoxal phosphate-dependent enzyme [Flavihumibacter sp. CACIAM 22H1]KYP14348.1 MAG: hypothetical protein A1D16_11490 [Flavihumibacter sp. CACIAM 22H1]
MEKANHRRVFLKSAGAAMLPALLPALPAWAANSENTIAATQQPYVKFYGDGDMLEPEEYLQVLNELQAAGKIERDRYGAGGSVEALEKEMARITGKEKAIFLPSGTLANQLAISLLSGSNTKVYVQDLSHVYRDEADAAQTVFSKRLMPLGGEKAFFTAAELKAAIDKLPEQEVFSSGIGAVSIENPVRRANGQLVPLEEIKAISAYCKEKQLPLHLDGARIFMTAAWSGHSVATYARYFDTVYISLYKYLGASSGAVLCGSQAHISQVSHLMKIHGGTMYGNWTNAAMALHRLDGFENRLQQAILAFGKISELLPKIPGFAVQPIPGGTNIYTLQLPALDAQIFQEEMRDQYRIRLPRPDEKNRVLLTVNETLLYRTPEEIYTAFSNSVKKATKAARR